MSDLALTDESVAAITDDGMIHVWGNNVKKTMDVPETALKASTIVGGRYHYNGYHGGWKRSARDDTFAQGVTRTKNLDISGGLLRHICDR